MISENSFKAIDNLGRITIPKGLRDRLGLLAGTSMEFFTEEVEGRLYVCMSPVEKEKSEDIENAIKFLESKGYRVGK